MKLLGEWLLVFFALVGMDFCWTRYLLAVADKAKAVAASWSAGIVGLSAFAAVKYVESPFLMTAAIAGAFVGTYAAMSFERKQ